MEAKPPRKIAPPGVRVRFQPARGDAALLAYCQLEIAIPELGMFACHSLKLLQRHDGAIRLEFPASPVCRPCGACRLPIPTGSRFCSRCGAKQGRVEEPARRDEFHPTNGPTREAVTEYVLQEFTAAGGFHGALS